MYKTPDKSQPSLLDFDQPLGLRMNPDNRWVQLADRVPWGIFEEKYAALFPSGTGNVAKPLRLALGSLIIQNRFQYSDRELVEQLSENPYLQYFIGLPGYQPQAPFDASTLVWFRKRITMDILNEANEYMLEHKDDDGPAPPASGGPAGGRSRKQRDTHHRRHLCPCEHPVPTGYFTPERGKGKAGIYHLPDVQVLWAHPAAPLSPECKERLPGIRKEQEAHREESP